VTTGGGAPVVLVVPVVPALGGNGLAMRAGMVLEALAEHCEVDLVVVPVSGPLAGTAWASSLARSLVVVEPVSDPATAREHLTRQLADPLLRERLARSAPLPQRARSVPATLAAAALSGLLPRARGARALFVLRGYLAPFGCALARALQAGRVIVDLDDDDEQFERSAGRVQEADAIGRLARAWLPDADIVCAAAPHEASAMAERYGLHLIRVLPNAIRPPAQTTVPPGEQRLLFVGNLTYAPNLDAAQVLAHEILPLVRETNPDATVDLVGPHDGSIVPAPHVRVAGQVAEVRPWYEGADVVVAPLLRGGGTRIKVLEAFAHRRPVVATAAAVSGLAVRDGHEVALGGSPQELADRIGALLAQPRRAAAMVQAATGTLSSHYLQEVVAEQVWALVADELPQRALGGASV
jgi:glycosyltransferase involved in cell wall biosynthesis